jgi:hypothetical protein
VTGGSSPLDTQAIVTAAREVLEREAQAPAGLVGQLDASFAEVVRAVLATPGKVVAPPRSEQDPRAWWDAFVAALLGARRDAGAGPPDMAANSVAAQRHGLLMFTEPGTKDVADSGQLSKVNDLSGQLPIAVDGGFTRTLASRCREHGASLLIAGRARLAATSTTASPGDAPRSERGFQP